MSTDNNGPEHETRPIVKFDNGDSYEGQWLDNKKHGEGIFTWKSGNSYKGQW